MLIPPQACLINCRIRKSMRTLNSDGAKIHSCRTPLVILNDSDNKPYYFTYISLSSCKSFNNSINLLGMRYFSNIRQSAALLTLSYAFFKSTIHINTCLFLSRAYSNNLRTLKMWSAQERPFRNPACATCNYSSICYLIRANKT